MIGNLVVTNNPSADDRQQRAEGITPAQAALAHQIINQRDIKRREDGKQQQFRDRQIEIGAETQHIHNAKLHRSHQHIQANGFYAMPTGTQKREKHQRCQPNTHQHCKIAINMTREILAEQAKGEGPQDSGNDE